ncbi:hypothetical protein ALC60_09809, partial [Trachymyrmex zeteki]
PLNTEIGVTDWFETRLKMSESTFSYAALILNRRFKFRWATRFRLLLHVLLVHRLLICFQFLGSLYVSQLFGDTQVCFAFSNILILTRCDWFSILIPLHFHGRIANRCQLCLEMGVTTFL